jgi:hypothetical protein
MFSKVCKAIWGLVKRRFLWLDWALAVVVPTSAYLCHALGCLAQDPVMSALAGVRPIAYQLLTGLFGTMLGFVIAAAAILLGVSGHDNLSAVRSSAHYPTLWKVYTASMRTLALATLMALVAFFMDRDESPVGWMGYTVLGATTIGASRVFWAVYFLALVIRIVAKPESKPVDSGDD